MIQGILRPSAPSPNRISRAWRAGLLSIFVSALGSAQTPLNTNLLLNPSFESGMTNWMVVASTANTTTYGTSGYPGNPCSNTIGGGGLFLRDVGGFAVVEQAVPLVSVPGGTNLRASGYFGGAMDDEARLVIRFLNAAGVEIALQILPPVTASNRNFETVLLKREAIMEIPSGTATIVARIEFVNNCCGSAWGVADLISLVLTTTSVIPPPHALNTELLVNSGFEAGWNFGSPLSLVNRGWEGMSGSAVFVKPYSNVDSTVPSEIVSCLIGGGPSPLCVPGGAGNLLSDSGGGGIVRQRIDLRGDASQIGAGLALRVSGYLGGTSNDESRLDVLFLNAAGVVISPVSPLGPVTQFERNSESVVVRRTADYFIPPQTAFAIVDVVFINNPVGGAQGLADKVSAKLVPLTSPVPLPLNTNLISNGSFESGSLPGSPLELTNSTGWRGSNGSVVTALSYGSSSGVPSAAFASANGLGGQVVNSDTGILRQTLDLNGHQSLINNGRCNLVAEAWLGGVGASEDSPELRVQFQNFAGVQVGGASGLQILGPVSAVQRSSATTLLRRSVNVQVPVGAVRVLVQLGFNNFSCCNTNALADGINVFLYDSLFGAPVLHPGSNEDLRLLTGVNGTPTSGPGNEIKTATSLDILNVRVESPGASFNFSPLLLLAHVKPTTTPLLLPPPPPGFPNGLFFDPFALGSVIVYNGASCTGFGCPVVLPGGTVFNFVIPTGMAGTTIVLQPLAFPYPGSPVIPVNGIFAGGDGHEVRVL